MNGSEHSGSALSYVTNRSIRELSEVVQGLEVVTPVIQDNNEEDGDKAEASLVVSMPAPVFSSEEEEETQEVICSDTLLLGLEPVPQVRGQLPSWVGPMRNTSNNP